MSVTQQGHTQAVHLHRRHPDGTDEHLAASRLPRWVDGGADGRWVHPAPLNTEGASDVVALLPALEAAGVAVVLLDVAGRVVVATGALDRLLAPDAERTAVWQAARALATQVRGQPDAGCWSPAELGARVAKRQVDTAAGTYQLVTSVPGHPRNAWAAVVVERRTAPPATDEWLGAARGLSARERQVARLLAAGRTTAEVGAALGISAHTARHHVERVYQKLGVRSRVALGAMLAQPAHHGAEVHAAHP